MKVGLFGGSFNPIHNSHVTTIEYLINKKIVDQVWIIPCKDHVFNKGLIDAKDRVKMIELATKDIDGIKINRIELKTSGKSYAINTLRKLKEINPQHSFFFVIGSDILYEIDAWHKYKDLLKEIDFIVFERKGYEIKNVKGLNIIYLIKEKSSSISSSEIRKNIKEGRSLKNLVSKNLMDYIIRNKLYL